MTAKSNSRWKKMRNAEAEHVERIFKAHGFRKTDAYRYGSASIRIRIVSKKFASMTRSQRLKTIRAIIHTLPEELQCKILFAALLAPSEVRYSDMNERFEKPEPLLRLPRALGNSN